MSSPGSMNGELKIRRRSVCKLQAEFLQFATARGAGALLNTYDAAYIGAIEKIRGRVTPAEYARVVVGGERGQTNEVLAALKIQRSAVMRLKRVFAKRMAVDAALKAEVNRALAELRK